MTLTQWRTLTPIKYWWSGTFMTIWNLTSMTFALKLQKLRQKRLHQELKSIIHCPISDSYHLTIIYTMRWKVETKELNSISKGWSSFWVISSNVRSSEAKPAGCSTWEMRGKLKFSPWLVPPFSWDLWSLFTFNYFSDMDDYLWAKMYRCFKDKGSKWPVLSLCNWDLHHW